MTEKITISNSVSLTLIDIPGAATQLCKVEKLLNYGPDYSRVWQSRLSISGTEAETLTDTELINKQDELRFTNGWPSLPRVRLGRLTATGAIVSVKSWAGLTAWAL